MDSGFKSLIWLWLRRTLVLLVSLLSLPNPKPFFYLKWNSKAGFRIQTLRVLSYRALHTESSTCMNASEVSHTVVISEILRLSFPTDERVLKTNRLCMTRPK